MNTIRDMYNGNTQRPDLEVLDKVLKALHVLTKRSVGLTDVLEYNLEKGRGDDGQASA